MDSTRARKILPAHKPISQARPRIFLAPFLGSMKKGVAQPDPYFLHDRFIWKTLLQSEPAGPAARSKVLLLIDNGNGGFDEAPGGRRPRKEVYVHAPDEASPKLDIAGTRPGVSWGVFAAL